MPGLLETITAANKRDAVISDCLTLIDQEVDSKSGLSGIAIKTAFKLVKNFKPGFVRDAVDALLDDFCKNLDPLVAEAQTQQKPVGSYFVSNRGKVAEALLAITDSRAQKSKHGAIKSTYDRLRGSAKKNVEEAVPRIGSMIEKYAK